MTSGRSTGSRRILARAGFVLFALVAVAVIGFGLMFWIGGNDVNNFCQEAQPGFAVTEMSALAAKHNVRISPGLRDASGARTLLAHTPRSYGRHTCVVRHDDDVVLDRQVGYAN